MVWAKRFAHTAMFQGVIAYFLILKLNLTIQNRHDEVAVETSKYLFELAFSF